MDIANTYTVPDLVELFDSSPGKVRRMFEEQILAAVKIDGVLRVPKEFINDGVVVSSLRGTLIVLTDAGLSTEEAVDWLLTENDHLGDTPISLLRKGQKANVRSAALLLG
ncbi:Rv2175c family DNA-binding protein [Canibacter zhoujuaniae]|uniref:Rv2175c family DNA-binding protein n=1 Tax=Canibacter zhoujuaniae TaxID=2708343 RepID=UPI001FBAB1F8|nr:Rv2175c family DNA-binding protein [Canibacter zhoujuaniae]